MNLLWRLESIRTPFWDTFFGLVTRFGEEMLLIVVFCVVFWCINKRMAYVLGIAFFLSGLIVQGLKILTRIPRPWVADPTFSPVGGATYAATGYAFPSGHTANATAYLGALGVQVKRRIFQIVLITLVILVAFSRLYLGVHYLSDVLASLAITFAVIIISTKIITEEPVSKKRELLLSLFIALCALVVIVIAIVFYYGELTEPHQLRDGTRVAGAALAFAIGMFVERNYIRFSVKAKNIPLQIIKPILGIAGTIAIQEIVRAIGTGLVIDAARYFLMVAWITMAFPLIINKFFAHKTV